MAIQSFQCPYTESFFKTGTARRWNSIIRVAARKLTMLDAATDLNDLRSPPGNRLESLEGNRLGQHSIRINGQFRICFTWGPNGPESVAIIDYH